MKLPTCLWMLGAGVFLSITSTHAQRSENIIDLNAEFNEMVILWSKPTRNGSALSPWQLTLSMQPIWLCPHAIEQQYVPAVL